MLSVNSLGLVEGLFCDYYFSFLGNGFGFFTQHFDVSRV